MSVLPLVLQGHTGWVWEGGGHIWVSGGHGVSDGGLHGDKVASGANRVTGRLLPVGPLPAPTSTA